MAVPLIIAGTAIIITLIVVAGVVIVTLQRESATARGPLTIAETTTSSTRAHRTTRRTTARRTTTRTTTRTTATTPTVSTAATPTGTAALTDNPLYADSDAGLIRQVCDSVGWPSDEQAGKTFFDSVIPCLEKAWRPLVSAAGLTYLTPTVLVPGGTVITSPCGTIDLTEENVAAFYCPTNQTLYMPLAGLDVDRYQDQPIIYIALFAHEFGHHVQEMTGILSEQWDQRRAAGVNSAAGLEISRRKELQAQCFSGMFVGSITGTGGMFTQADYQVAYDDQERGDWSTGPRDHGTNQHAQSWWKTGGDTDQIGQCNTWAAPSADVE